jgi:hypothetical protein
MNEGGGNGLMDVVQNNGGLLVNGPARGGSKLGPAISFDGSDDHVIVPHHPRLSILGDMSAVVWVNPTNYGNYRMMFTKTNGGTAGPYAMFLNIAGGVPTFFRGNGAAEGNSAGTTAPATGVWSQVAVTHRGTAVSHYLNALDNGTGAISAATADSGNPLYFGRRADGYYFLGGMAHLRLYNRALSAVEVAQLYADPLAGARAPVSAARYFVSATISPPAAIAAPPTADRLWNRGYVGRIFRRGEKG